MIQSRQGICTKFFHFESALLATGWMTPAYVGIDDHGSIHYISPEPPQESVTLEHVNGLALPGFQNCHSHAFQYAMAGMAEKHTPGTSDDFWSWREAMYQCALSLDPDQIQTVATTLYIEMLKKGYTSVAEFHYLHHDKNGIPFNNKSEICVSLIAAAAIAGIKITLIPVFYQKGGFGKEAQPRQRRFIFSSMEDYFRLLEDAEKIADNITTAQLGFGVHSLRAVDAADVIKIFETGPKKIPFHLHAAEQLKEVDDAVEYLRARPVEWLLDHLPVDSRFNFVHCTHMNGEEILRLAKSGANAVLCPGTEGNLGDGIFRLWEFEKSGGHWCIGTDSHISLNPLEDLRWLDYGQRMLTHKRNTFNDGGLTMIKKSFLYGSSALGNKRRDFFEIGKPLDAVVYDCNARLISEFSASYSLSRVLYTADSSCVFGTLVNGKWIIKNGFHHEEERMSGLFTKVLRAITSS